MDYQRLIDESRPMLDDILGRIGIHRTGEPLDLDRLREPLSQWLQKLTIGEKDFFNLVSLVGAFISEYLIEKGAVRSIENEHIVLSLWDSEDAVKQFDPYAAAISLLKSKASLNAFLENVAPTSPGEAPNPNHP